MKLLLDENLSPQHAIVLRGQGYDAIAVIEAGLKGQPDQIVRAFAIQSGRVLSEAECSLPAGGMALHAQWGECGHGD